MPFDFFGSMPAPMQRSKLYGVELDSISGRIAKQLYQNANISITGFENTTYPDNFFDVVVGNVPFGDYKVFDPKYNKYNFRIHDYFLAKALDQVRPGGMVAVITTKGTLDKANPTIRKYMAELIDIQMDGCSEEELSDNQRLLNVKYDAFIKQYGAITSKANRIAFRDDSDYPLLCSLEEVNEDGEVKKADMFYKQTIKAKTVIDRVETAVEALNVSVNEFGYVNLAYILSIYEPDITNAKEELAEKSGKTADEITFSDEALAELRRAVLMEELDGKTLTNEEVIRELLELLKKNAMKEQANDVFEICSYVDGLEKKVDSMTEELTIMQNQIKEMQEDTLVNNAKKALSEAQERLGTRCEQIKSQVLEVKAQVKSTAKSIVDEAKAKGRTTLYRVSEFLGIKKRILDIRENVRGAIKTTDKDIAKTALLAKGFREAGQTAANAFRTFADKPEVDYSQKEQKHFITKAVLAPMKAVKKMLVSMELHLDASIDKLDNLAMNVEICLKIE